MYNVKAILFVLILPLISGCISLYSVEKNTPATENLKEFVRPGDTSGITKIYVGRGSNKDTGEYYANETDLFFLAYSPGGRLRSGPVPASMQLRGITSKIEEYCFLDDHSKDYCMKKFIDKHGVEKVDLTEGSTRKFTVISKDHLYITFESEDNGDGYLVTTYVDGTKGMTDWKSRYSNIKESNRIEDYFEYADTYPISTQSRKAMDDMFTRFFKVSVVSSKESVQRATTSGGIMSSSAGSCKDVSYNIKIEPRTTQLPPREVTVDINYILKRTYEPYQLEKKDDPLFQGVVYRLRANNNFTVTDNVAFDCVLTSGRFHFAAMSFLTRLAGAKNVNDTGVNTTLTKLGFDANIESVK
ncbi:hypothetical protein HGA64_04780 [Candidatus Falkowbacteria bacterium]|nr:hypothetical protein [Candidatus Falkowbacteria bacterium]